MAGDSDRVRELELELEGAQQRIRALDAKIAANLARERKAQQRIAAAERLQSAAVRAAGAARTLRGPLNYAALNLDYVLAELVDGGSIPADVRSRLEGSLLEARESVQQLDELVGSLEGDAPDSGRVAVTEDLEAVLLAAIRTARGLPAAAPRITTEFEELPPVFGDEARLAEVFFHLVSNATEAFERSPRPDPHICVATRKDVGGGVFVTVADNGPGIPAEHLDRVFEPFFTTKRSERGAGLGLTLCREWLGELGGEIHVQSREGSGTAFSVRLERAVGEPANGSPPASRVRFVTTKPPVRRLSNR